MLGKTHCMWRKICAVTGLNCIFAFCVTQWGGAVSDVCNKGCWMGLLQQTAIAVTWAI